MALTASALTKVAGAAPGLFIYQTADTLATVTASGYFDSVTNNLKQFDVILVVSATGGTALVDPIVVTSATGAATVTTSSGETA